MRLPRNLPKECFTFRVFPNRSHSMSDSLCQAVVRLHLIPLLSFIHLAMPQSQMLTSLKNVSESMIGLLTLLLQVLVHQLECQPPTEDNEETPNAEVTQTMNNMLQELQNQKQVLQSLVANQMSRDAARPLDRQIVPSTAAASSPAPAPNRARPGASSAHHPNVSTTLVNRVLQDLHLPTPGSPSPSTWILAEEEEEFEEMNIPEISRTRLRPSNIRATPQPQSTQVSLADWGSVSITWGRKHKGKTYQEVFQTDIGYYHWSLARFQSLPPNQQDFVRYCQVRLELEAQNWVAALRIVHQPFQKICLIFLFIKKSKRFVTS